MRSPPIVFLRRHHCHRLWAAAILIGAGGFLLDRVLEHLGADSSVRLWVLEGAAVLALFTRLFRRQSLRATACDLDDRLGLANRLEALVEFGMSDEPFATALRGEVSAYWTLRRLRASWAWLLGPVVVVLLGFWVLPSIPPRTRPARSPIEVVARPGPATAAPVRSEAQNRAAFRPATLRWRSPQTTIDATPAEIVPLSVQAESPAGMVRFQLHVKLNGKMATSIPESCAAPAGIRTLSLKFDLRRVGAKPHDIVEYWLTASREQPAGSAESLRPEVSSPVQTIRIRPLRGDLTQKIVGMPVMKLPDRAQTPAGRLERLAAEQHALARRIARGGASPDAAVAEDRIARVLARLADFDGFAPRTGAAIKSAAAEAKTTARQLNAGDQRAATEPAAVVDQTLAATIKQLNAAGRTKALMELAAVQRAFIRAADDLVGASGLSASRGAQSALDRTATARNALARLAFQQQQQGSATAARQLDELRRAVDRSQVQADLKKLAGGGNGAVPQARAKAANESNAFRPVQQQDNGGDVGSKSQSVGGGSSKKSSGGSQSGSTSAGGGGQGTNSESGTGQMSARPESVAPGAVGGRGGGPTRAGTEETLMALGQQAANAQWQAAGSGGLERREIDELRLDVANLDRAVELGPQDMLGLYESTVRAAQLLPHGRKIFLLPPIVGVAGLRGYASTLGSQIKDLLAHLPAAPNEPTRRQTLVIGNPDEAPAAYRAAVADYFESLARDSTTPADGEKR